jgi:transcription antitermination protein NusB
MARTRIETRARARALQALYAWEVRDHPDLLRLTAQVWDDLQVPPEERRLANRILRRVADSVTEIDAQITDVTTNWRIERLGVIERCVLRLSVAELMMPDTPPRVVLQESVRLAERFGTERSARFVNGVLDAIARRLGRI